jgi:hypothetical protein
MEHVTKHPFLKAARVTTFERLDLRRRRTCLPGVVVFLEEKKIDL